MQKECVTLISQSRVANAFSTTKQDLALSMQDLALSMQDLASLACVASNCIRRKRPHKLNVLPIISPPANPQLQKEPRSKQT